MQATLDRILSTDPSAWPRSLPQADTVVGLGRDGTDADPLPFQNTTEYVGYFERLAEVELCSELSSVLDAVLRALSTAPSIRQAASTIQVYPRGGPVPCRGPRTLSTNVHAAPASSEAAADALLDIPIKIQSKETIFDNDILLLLLDVDEDRGVPSPLLSRVRKEPMLAAVQHRAGSPLTLRLRRDRAEAWLTSQGASSTTPDVDETAGDATSCRSCVGIRLVSTLNYAREFAALASIDEMDLAADILDPVTGAQRHRRDAALPATRTELDVYLAIISEQRGLNRSQHEAVRAAALGQQGFELIHGPPGTGKTKTMLALLNVLHMSKYQEYYDAYLSALAPAASTSGSAATSTEPAPPSSDGMPTKTPMLEQILESVRSTTAAATAAAKLGSLRSARHAAAAQRKPRLLVAAQSNAAVDEIVVRIMREGFMDCERRTYYPDIVRIGAGARVSLDARAVTAEARADAFLRTLETTKQCTDWSQRWDHQCAVLVEQLEKSHPPGDDLEARRQLMRLWDRLDRLQRDERRFRMATWPDSRISREQRIAWIASTFLEEAEIVLCTLSGAALIKSWLRDAFSMTSSSAPNETNVANKAWATSFPVVIIDEAAQATELATLIPLQYGCRRCILAGDPRQLPATVYSRGDAGIALAQSLMERLWRAGWSGHLLDTQYRMHPAIAAFPSRWFYQGQLENDERVRDESYRPSFHRTGPPPPLLGPYCFVDIADAAEERDSTTASVGNPTEAAFAIQLVRILCKRYLADSSRTWQVGILTPYRAQMRLLQRALGQAGLSATGKATSFTIEVDTVDAFQGREKDIVIFSAVRTCQQRQGIGFVGDVRRMNVALTRAKYSLVVLGHAAALRAGSAAWDALLQDAEHRGLYFEATSDLVQQWLQRHAIRGESAPPPKAAVEAGPALSTSTATASPQIVPTLEHASIRSSTLPSSTSVAAFASALDPRLRQRPAVDGALSDGASAARALPTADASTSASTDTNSVATDIDARTFMIASMAAGFSLPSVVAAAYQAFPMEANQIALIAAELGAQTGLVRPPHQSLFALAPSVAGDQTQTRARRKRKAKADVGGEPDSSGAGFPPSTLGRDA